MNYQPIKCSDYDQLELYCMHGNNVSVTLATLTIKGVAKTLETVKGEGEFLILQTANNNIAKIRLDEIKTISLA
ncbi:Rho-binding antiterminator [Pseudoalteromonas sp.]|jgi:Rho-binding antiterminator|uniref:Rho-binding antiterminator n=1 Tax=Pseudoalteromonas sp. TaxID=53249 RepID=UPI003563B2C3